MHTPLIVSCLANCFTWADNKKMGERFAYVWIVSSGSLAYPKAPAQGKAGIRECRGSPDMAIGWPGQKTGNQQHAAGTGSPGTAQSR
jgi:hypothetical protein